MGSTPAPLMPKSRAEMTRSIPNRRPSILIPTPYERQWGFDRTHTRPPLGECTRVRQYSSSTSGYYIKSASQDTGGSDAVSRWRPPDR